MFRWRPLAAVIAAVMVMSIVPLAVSIPANAMVRQKAKCSHRNGTPFVPVSVFSRGLGRVEVKALKPRRNGLPQTLPLTSAGKTKIAWDKPSFRPGAATGHVLMSAHVWPDGSAVGNRLNLTLKRGKIIKVMGAQGQVQCYRLSQRVVKKPSRRLAKSFYGDVHSAHRLVILTCTGVRRGPGDWSLRSLWFATPIR